MQDKTQPMSAAFIGYVSASIRKKVMAETTDDAASKLIG
jgi:hypothetical protein